ncbi:SnoaL-like domain-containing protein [Parasphingorhabdus sp.]|jgi:hypothetical protein|uniref:SnoaL-like domain-containing protein n=1 Tax=Parasphingorhabdus sp. TaxID=2709688 RepID=UPI003D29BC2E
MSNLVEIAEDFTALMAAGKLKAAADKYWATDIRSFEPAAMPLGSLSVLVGFEAARAQQQRWTSDNRMEDVLIDGPFITGDHFALFIDMEIVRRTTGKREPFSEIAVYTVRGGKIVEQRHFHG